MKQRNTSFLAPMMRITDHPGFLYLCKMKGCDVIVLPMMFMEGIASNSKYIEDILNVLYKNEQNFDFRPIIIQLTGKNLDTVDRAIQILSSYDIQGINLNMGCPSGRIRAQGLGASLLDRPKDRDAVIDSILKHSPFPLSIKMRIFGKTEPDIPSTIQFCKVLEGKDISWIAVHGRIGRQGYKGKADWTAIKAIHGATSLFLVGNGDITSLKQGMSLVEQNYCDAFMIGRAAVKDPRVFSPVFDPCKTKTSSDALDQFKEIIGFLINNREQTAALLVPHEIKKWALFLSRQVPGSRSFRAHAMNANSIDDIEALFKNMKVACR